MNDDELRQRFVELRERERRLVRPFAVRSRPRRAAWWLVSVAGLLLIALVLRPHAKTEFSNADALAARQIAEWQAPTDTLLVTPAQELLVSVPEIPEIPKGVPR